jgi:hypothetical protein
MLPFLAAAAFGVYRFFTRATAVTDESDRTLCLLAVSLVTFVVLMGVARVVNKHLRSDNENYRGHFRSCI